MSFAAFFIYAEDKRRAKNSAWRVQENTLHVIELLGGWPGALSAQRELRHKSMKQSYQIIFWAIVAVHLDGWAYFIVNPAPLESTINLIKNIPN